MCVCVCVCVFVCVCVCLCVCIYAHGYMCMQMQVVSTRRWRELRGSGLLWNVALSAASDTAAAKAAAMVAMCVYVYVSRCICMYLCVTYHMHIRRAGACGPAGCHTPLLALRICI